MTGKLLLWFCVFVLMGCVHRLPQENANNSSSAEQAKKKNPRIVVGYYKPYEDAKTSESIIRRLERENETIHSHSSLYSCDDDDFKSLCEIWGDEEFLALAHHKKATMRPYSIMALRQQNSPYLDSAISILSKDHSKVDFRIGCLVTEVVISEWVQLMPKDSTQIRP